MTTPEEIQSPRLEDIIFTHKYLHAAQEVGSRALRAMALHYGCLAFHNEQHPRIVAEATNHMAGTLGLSQLAQVTAEVAAKAHDVVQLKPRGIMERESADWLEQQLLRRYPKAGIDAARLAILGTEPVFENGKIAGQMATRLEYPSKEAEAVGLSVASADLGGELFRPIGPYRGHMFYKEMQGVHDPCKAPSLDGLLKFQLENVELTADYRFPQPEGEAVLGALRSEVVGYHEQLAAKLQAGTIESWEQVLAEDLSFARERGDGDLQAAML